MYPGFLKEVLTGYVGGVHIAPCFLVAAAVLTEVPIAMIVLSRPPVVPSALGAGIRAFRSCSMERGGDRVAPPWANGPAGEDAWADEPVDRCRFIG